MNSQNGFVKVCSKIIGAQQRDLRTLWEKKNKKKKQVVLKAKGIISQPHYALSREFILIPSGRHYNVPLKKNRTAFTVQVFFPSAISLLNVDRSIFTLIKTLCT